MHNACKGYGGNGPLSEQRVRLLQPLLPHSQKGRWVQTDSWSQSSKPSPDATAVQNVNLKADPRANSAWGLAPVCESEKCLLSHPNSAPSQTVLEIRIRGDGLSVYSPPVWTVRGPRTFTKCIDAALSPLRQMESAYWTTSTTGWC